MDSEGPNTVKGLLAEIKDSSELMVDLAYAAVYFAEEDLAKEKQRATERLALERMRNEQMQQQVTEMKARLNRIQAVLEDI